MLRWASLAAAIALAPAGVLAQGAADCGAPPDLKDGWRVSAPQEQQLAPALICSIGPEFDAWKPANAHAVVVVRHGVLVYERYFAGEDERFGEKLGRVAFDARTLHDLRSVSKSITSLAVGIALDRGWLKDLDAPVFSFFPEYPELRTPEKERITLRHLLTMSAGLAWNENVPYSNPANSEVKMIGTPDPYRFVLAQPVATPPGQIYNYNGGGTMLLAKVLAKASGKPFDVLVKEALFEPLGIAEAEWARYPSGDANAASGLRLRPRDLARIGQMVLARGLWQGRRIVASSWIEQSTTPQINGEGLFFYGFQWWLGRTLSNRREVGWWSAVGWGGQRVFVVPDEDIVVVVTAGLYNGPIFQGAVGATVLNGHVLPAAAAAR